MGRTARKNKGHGRKAKRTPKPGQASARKVAGKATPPRARRIGRPARKGQRENPATPRARVPLAGLPWLDLHNPGDALAFVRARRHVPTGRLVAGGRERLDVALVSVATKKHPTIA